MLIFDLFAGTGSATLAFSLAGHQVIKFEIDRQFKAEEYVDVCSLNAKDLLNKYGRPDFIWASPPCTAFSVASIGHHWGGGYRSYEAKTALALHSQALVAHTVKLIKELNAKHGWLIENPRGILRKLDVVKGLPRQTVTYCQYGDQRMKPTDLWGKLEGWEARPMCKNGDSCHQKAPRGSRTGTQGLKNSKIRAEVPLELSTSLLLAVAKRGQIWI